MNTNQTLFYDEQPITDEIKKFLTARRWGNVSYDSKCIEYFNSRIDFVHDVLLELGVDVLQYFIFNY